VGPTKVSSLVVVKVSESLRTSRSLLSFHGVYCCKDIDSTDGDFKFVHIFL
jgi:hypothetical protein